MYEYVIDYEYVAAAGVGAYEYQVARGPDARSPVVQARSPSGYSLHHILHGTVDHARIVAATFITDMD